MDRDAAQIMSKHILENNVMHLMQFRAAPQPKTAKPESVLFVLQESVTCHSNQSTLVHEQFGLLFVPCALFSSCSLAREEHMRT